MVDNILLSIVIPTYNRADFIAITLQSVLEQTSSNYEVIIVDDGSTDNTEEVVKPFLQYNQFSYYKKVNGERGAARNYGAERANGQYLNFFDSDDLLYPNHVEEIEKIVKNHNPSAFHLAYDVKNKNLQLLSKVQTIDEDIIKGNPYSCNGIVVKKSVFDKFKFTEDRILAVSEDYELWLRLFANVGIVHFSVITSTVIQHDERSVMVTNFDKLLKRRDAFFQYAFADKVVQEKYGNKKDLFYSYWQSYIALHLIIANQKKEALKYYLDSLKKNPTSFITKRSLAIIKNLIIK